MAGMYTVVAGDHISRLAEQFGFAKYETIWNHPQNADLKALRKNPNILNPGDQVYIPDADVKTLDRPADVKHSFTKPAETLKLRLVLNRMYNKPYAIVPCTLSVGSVQTDLTTDGNAQIEQTIKRLDSAGSVKLNDQITVSGGAATIQREVDFQIGFLTPLTEVSGQIGRLANLGYYRGPASPPDLDEFKSAVEEFQCENSLSVDGICGPLTQAKLKSVYGC